MARYVEHTRTWEFEEDRSRWEQILEVLVVRIDSGEWGPKFKISEVKLMEEFGVSRPTIRKAMQRLRAADKIYTVPNLGSFVNSDGKAPRSSDANEP
ncbi:winged helix-turn-helix transcriptional regulator [Nonomuraea sp. K274]|uniref:Winged helix-turn-helix transcriptional regulator n=1 Tax=Nonomuraea cypriaca TaxID=1187855 RepID=A0A931EW27_9ACTN|nr:winged helix-turn-helix domain-containing protein [Nonomuraea cypriaca]MBF8186259.1 winged helix-turn-helix transcriptional regulator [Nonomuraea cypriaca]